MRKVRLLFTLVLLLAATAAQAQTGKIAGEVTDAASGEPLPGVNVVIEGTTQGSTTDVNGYFVILNVRPGTYDVRASFIGFTPAVREGVRVNVDLTTEVNFALQEEEVGLDEIVVRAERPVVQRDVSSSVANVSAEEIENLPVTDVERVVGLQAGFERGLTVRGEGGDQVQFQIDGLSMNSGLDNTPFTGVSYTAVEEMQVQSGGFSAEHGNVRSGLITVVTKDPPRDRYIADAIARYSPASPKTFSGVDINGNPVNGPDSDRSFYMRPMLDPEVSMIGTQAAQDEGIWQPWEADEYRTFAGWESIAETYNSQNGTNFTPQQLQQVFVDHYLRKDFTIEDPNYEVDATIGGPVPGVSSLLGDLRFLASFRQTQNPYELAGFARDRYQERLGQGKLVSDVARGMKLSIQGLVARQSGLNRDEQGLQRLTTGDIAAYPWDTAEDNGYQSMIPLVANGTSDNADRDMGETFTDLTFHLMDVDRTMLGAQFTHTLSPSTFYEVQLQRMSTDYNTRTLDPRNEEPTFSYLGGDIQLNEAPFGYTASDRQDDIGAGMITAGHWGSGYDNSTVQRYTARLDLTSQLNRYSLMKAGVEYLYADYDVDYGEDDPEHPHNGDEKWRWNRAPQQAAAYATNKLEFGGMIANVGLRLDYFHPGGDWYVFDAFERAFTASVGVDQIDEALEQEPTDPQLALSPRLGVSFPVTDESKLYFNYGHFRNMLDPTSLFEVRSYFTGAVRAIGNPNHPMPKTVAYELGFEQSLFDQYLLRLAGYYKDLTNQPREVNYLSLDDLVDYRIDMPWNYSDVRGFELTLMKNQGEWVRGFVNYTYMSRKEGNFGFSRFDENRTAMNQFVTNTTEHYAQKPIPEPYARASVEVLLPNDLGPEVGGVNPLGDWRINLLGEWRLGQAMTWDGNNLTPTSTPATGQDQRELHGNVRWRDYYMLDMRLSKNFDAGFGSAQFFVDLTNVLNLRHMYLSDGALFYDGDSDLQDYMESLRLPEGTYDSDSGPFGDDQPGDFREPGVAYVPINVVSELPESGHSDPLYYHSGEGTYYQWQNGSFSEADQSRVDQVLDDRAYIDMPNRTYSTFLNPRNVYLGVRLTF